MGSGVAAVVRRLRERQAEIEDAVFARVREVVPEAAGDADSAYVRGLRGAAAAVVELGIAGLERGGEPAPLPSREQRLLERVRMLLADEHAERNGGPMAAEDPALDFDFDGEHLAVIATGPGSEAAVRELAEGLGCRLLSVAPAERTVWAWLQGRRGLDMSAVQRLAGGGEASKEVSLATGEPAWGLAGWRLTHRQAQAALLVAARRPRPLTRYADVALLAAALKDESLGRALLTTYIAPLEESRDGGLVLRETLRGYLAAERNASSAAAVLGVARSTVERRMAAIELCLGRALHPLPAELEVALELDALGSPVAPGDLPMGAISATRSRTAHDAAIRPVSAVNAGVLQ